MIERERPQRPPFVPRWVLPVVAASVAVLLLAVGLGMWLVSRSTVSVPNVIGVNESVARTRLAQAGLTMEVVERPFDASEAGTVIDQDPAPGTAHSQNEPVRLTVSAGTEEFEMPDVVGLSLRIAQAQLEDLGLAVKVESVDSDAPEDTVLSTNPAPGATVRTTDIVRVTVAASGLSGDNLVPYTLDGALLVIDPAAPVTGQSDVTMEVARRLRSLLEASGAKVTLTRSGTTGTIETTASADTTGTAAAVIGLSVAESGAGDVAIVTLPEGGNAAASSKALADAVEKYLVEAGLVVARETSGADPVLEAAVGASMRVRLGAWTDAEDKAAFSDPAWADKVARAIYRGIGERLGAR